jgi:hypothetical protein
LEIVMKRLTWIALATAGLVGCGDDGGGDGVDVDAPADIDAPVDIDAPAATFSGSISLLEVAVLNPGTGGTFFGQGPQVSAALFSNADVPGPTLQEMPSSNLGCKAWEYTPAQAAAAAAGSDEGSVGFTLNGTNQPTVPSCTFTAGVGYTCPELATASTGGVIAAGPQAMTGSLTDSDNNFMASDTNGRYVRITGATNAANNGVFPIIARASANTIIYGTSVDAVPETIPNTGSHVNVYGLGPIPNAQDPGFLENDLTANVVLTAGGGNHFTTFTSTTGVGTIGDDFTLATAELNKLNAIPKDGSAFTVTCDAADCPSGSAAGTVLNIVTTDTATTGLSPFAMPAPTTKQVKIRCAVLGQTAITVPAAYSALIMGSGSTRIQASFIRGALLGGGPESVSVVAGHAIVGFTN